MKMPVSLAVSGIHFILCTALLVSCGPAETYQGSYVFEGGSGIPAMLIEFKEDGTGVWRKEGERVSFNWDLKGEEIRLHLKDGGVLVGNRKDDGFQIVLPGTALLTFLPGGK